MGRSLDLAPEATNCAAPDTGNMEVLHLFGTPEQQEEWLRPLLDGEIRSRFGDDRARRRELGRDATSPPGSSGTATTTSSTAANGGSSGAADPRCKIMIVMGKTDPAAASYRQQSMILVPMDTPGVEVVRELPVFGYHDQHGHCEVAFNDVRVPLANLIGEEGAGFAIAQARLGPGPHPPLHARHRGGRAGAGADVPAGHLPRAFGKPLAQQGVIQQWIAESRMAIEQARLLTLKAAWMIDRTGAQGGPQRDRGHQGDRAAGRAGRARPGHPGARRRRRLRRLPACRDVGARRATLRIADGPDEVHVRSVARAELGRYVPDRA